jgi:multidrug efflux pump subunit AcrA (membrane-fusion protein)
MRRAAALAFALAGTVSVAAAGPALRLHGTVEPVRSHPVVVPRLAGSNTGSLVIVRLLKPGPLVRRGDVLIEFDRQAQIRNAHDKEAEYRDFVEQINKARGEEITARAHDEAEIKTAENAVKSAKLEMLKNEPIRRKRSAAGSSSSRRSARRAPCRPACGPFSRSSASTAAIAT